MLDHQCSQGNIVEVVSLGIKLQVLSVPGHTKGHIAYYLERSSDTPHALFCGDTLFSGGCGRLFEGTAGQMWQSFQKLMKLPDDTLVCAAHEYTLSNLDFALDIEPDNQKLIDYKMEVSKLRKSNTPSLPSTIGLEKQINPFMRVEQSSIISAAQKRSKALLKSDKIGPETIFALIRQAKDTF